jgi:hypothetical protein
MPRSRILLVALMLLAGDALRSQSTVPIGAWQDHYPYRQCIAVAEGGGQVYAATANSLFRFDPASKEIEKLSKVNALSDVGIQGLAWNEPLQMLLVYYTNGNLDLLEGTRATNLGDIKRSNILGNKGIYGVYFDGTTAYLACGFGIVVLDLARKEVRDTWRIGPGGTQIQVNAITFHGDSIHAATRVGLFSAPRQGANLAAFESWRLRTDLPPAVADGPFNAVVSFNGKLLLNYAAPQIDRDTLYMLNADQTWSRFAPLFNRRNLKLDVSTDGNFVVIPHEGDMHMYGPEMQEINFIFGYAGQFANPRQGIRGSNASFWIADDEIGLVNVEGPLERSYLPNGPKNVNTWRMVAGGGRVYVASGAVTGTWSNSFLKDGIHMYANGEWSTSDVSNTPLMEGVNGIFGPVNDIVSIAIDPDDPAHAFAGSWEEGLLELRDGRAVTIYNASNSSLQNHTFNSSAQVNVAGLDYDEDGNLWITNAWAPAPISVRTKSGEWKSFSPGTLLNGVNLMSDIVAASNGYKWIVRPRGNALLVFDDNGTITNTADDRYKLLNNTEGSGGLPTSDVFAVAEDKEGQIWVGTSKGVAVFYTPEAIFNGSGFDAQQILIEQDGNFQYLLETEFVSTIAVDGADRKWLGTQTGGVFLVSPDGRTEIAHFTEANSPLPSNTIYAITIDDLTGEVYIATDRGIMSYRGDAIEGLDENSCATVFPNPVKESYTGQVAITGLVRDSEVKITDVSGNLVYRTTSLGGQALWPATDMEGNRVSTGVYLIFAADQFGTSKCNTKVLVVR